MLAANSNPGRFQVVSRVSNVDDQGYGTFNADWSTPAYQYTGPSGLPYKYDGIYGVTGLNVYDRLNYRTYNSGAGGGYAYHYPVYRNGYLSMEKFDGISGITGAENNTGKPVGYYANMEYVF